MVHAVHRAETSPKRLGTDKQSFGDKAIFDLCAEYHTMRRSMILSPYFKLSDSHYIARPIYFKSRVSVLSTNFLLPESLVDVN
jgi:hypothetical protein